MAAVPQPWTGPLQVCGWFQISDHQKVESTWLGSVHSGWTLLERLGAQSGEQPEAGGHQLLQAVGGQRDSRRGATIATAAAKLHGSAVGQTRLVACLMLGSDCVHELMYGGPGWILLLLLLD